MFYDSELTLSAASRKDFLIVASAAHLSVLCAALMSSRPLWIIVGSIVVLFLSQLFHRPAGLLLGPTNKSFRIHCNGDLLLEEPAEEISIGVLSGTQWCSRYLAILRYKADGRVGHLVIFKIRQCPDQFRQLSVWLRHNSYNEGRQKS